MASSAERGRRRHWDQVDSDPEEEGDDAPALHTAPAGSHDVVPALAAGWPGLFSVPDAAVADTGARFPQSLVDVFFSAAATAHAGRSGARTVPDAFASSVAARARPVAGIGTALGRTARYSARLGRADRIEGLHEAGPRCFCADALRPPWAAAATSAAAMLPSTLAAIARLIAGPCRAGEELTRACVRARRVEGASRRAAAPVRMTSDWTDVCSICFENRCEFNFPRCQDQFCVACIERCGRDAGTRGRGARGRCPCAHGPALQRVRERAQVPDRGYQQLVGPAGLRYQVPGLQRRPPQVHLEQGASWGSRI